MVGPFANALQNPELKGRIQWLFIGFAIFALTVHIPIPGVNRNVWSELTRGELFQLLGMFSGGALKKFSIAAMSITPYINASIIMQLLGYVIPQLKDMQKEEGEKGRRKISQYTRWLAVFLAFGQASMMTISLANYHRAVFVTKNPIYLGTVILALVAGTCFLIWLGDLLTEKAIGNGVSLLIFAGIVMAYPGYMADALAQAKVGGPRGFLALMIFFGVALLLVMAIIAMTLGQRKVPVQYPKRQVGNKVYGGQSTYIPIRVNNAGVISIIFAISILYLPTTLASFIPATASGPMGSIRDTIHIIFNQNGHLYNLMYAGLVIFFTYFYSAITFNVDDLADNLKKGGGFIPGIRPGRPTAEYLDRLTNRLTFVSAIFLALLAVIPTYVMKLTGVTTFYLGSTSLLIIVGVALDTMQQIEARLVMRQYQGFMK